MEFLYFLESLRIPVLNEFMLLITMLGEETAFLAIALIVFWCVDKRRGYYIMTVGFIGTMLNQFLKLLCQVPRPWVLDPNFTILEQAREAAAGYSFPSGHTQMAVGTFGAMALTAEQKWIKWISVSLAVLVPFSRMYIGVHTPADVLASVIIALLLVITLKPMTTAGVRAMKDVLGLMLVLAIGLTLFVEFYPWTAEVDEHNLQSGMKNAYTMLGCISGAAVVYFAEGKYVNFDTKALWWAQILKVLLGLGTVIAIKEGFRAPLEMLLPVYPARAVRYFLIVLWAGIGWPCSFTFFTKLGVKK